MTAVVLTRAEVLSRRAALLASCRLSRAELYERAQAWTLTQDERNIYETLRTYDWLLGEDAVS